MISEGSRDTEDCWKFDLTSQEIIYLKMLLRFTILLFLLMEKK